jgi:general secretion pathway protein I
MRRTDRGFTLLEVVVALAIAAMALVVMLRAAAGGMLSVRAAGHIEEAVSRARSHLALMARDPVPIEGVTEGDDGSGFHWRLSVHRVASIALAPEQTVPGMALPSIYAVQVEISWKDAGRPRRVILGTERTAIVAGTNNG